MTEQWDGPALAEKGFTISLNGKGGGELVPAQGAVEDSSPREEGFLWLHLRQSLERDARTPASLPELDAVVMTALLAPETRPRCTFHDHGVVLNLRGVNLNPGADPEDMISIRLWVEKDRVVSVSRRRLMALEDILAMIQEGKGPKKADEFIIVLASRLTERIEPVLQELSERIDELEEGALAADPQEFQDAIVDARLQAIKLKRFIAPQRDALIALLAGETPWIDKKVKRRLHDSVDRVTRFAEALDALRERAQILQEYLMFLRTEVMNRQLLILSIAAAIFLPLGFLAGLLGMNVAGIPFAGNPFAFAVVAIAMIAIGAIQLWVFRRLKWI